MATCINFHTLKKYFFSFTRGLNFHLKYFFQRSASPLKKYFMILGSVSLSKYLRIDPNCRGEFEKAEKQANQAARKTNLRLF